MPVKTLDISETPFEGANYSEKSLIEDEIYGYVSDEFEAMAERFETVTGDDGKGRSVDPVIQMRLLEMAQSKLDEISARKFDHNTPAGGVPACGTISGPGCAGLGREGAETCVAPDNFNDVDDFDGCPDESLYNGNYTRSVQVVFAGADLGLAADLAKRITVTVNGPGGQSYQLSSYRSNF